MNVFLAGFAREVITPPVGVPLAGYFVPRPNQGALDDLHVKALLFSDGQTTCGVLSLDVCLVGGELLQRIRAELERQEIDFRSNLIISATHTHTAPYTADLFDVAPDQGFVERVAVCCGTAVKRAQADLAPAELHAGHADQNPFAFCRRFEMKTGRVVTNPGKLNPDIVRPDGEVDRRVSVLRVDRCGRTLAVVANLCNHTDTVDGNWVSADWPGRMEAALRRQVGYEVHVLTLIAPAGNVNHFDVSTAENQSSYAEAVRIGEGYAGIVAGVMRAAGRIEPAPLGVTRAELRIRARTIAEEEIAAAKSVLAETAAVDGGRMTSEELATGSGAVRRCFATELLAFAANEAGKIRRFDTTCLKFGTAAAILSLPGEPFAEIGIRIRQRSPFGETIVASLAQGSCGYVPLAECFSRGGYETMPVRGGGAEPDTAAQLITTAVSLL
jgi:neutral ceramidase